MTAPSSDSSGVVFPPPLVYALGFLIGYVLHRLFPLPLPRVMPSVAGWASIAAGVLLAGAAAYRFRQAGQTPIPTQPVTALVVKGPYRFTRNPMYIAMTLVYLGGLMLLGDAWPLLVLPAVLVVIRRAVIAREEAYLERKFGEAYRAYTARVRRWL